MSSLEYDLCDKKDGKSKESGGLGLETPQKYDLGVIFRLKIWGRPTKTDAKLPKIVFLGRF